MVGTLYQRSRLPNNKTGRSLSNSIQELEGTQFIEKDMFEPMGMFGSNNDSPLQEEPTAEGNFNLYEENCPYRRDELFKFRLIESFSEYDGHLV